MGHRRARLTPFGRYLLVTRILQGGLVRLGCRGVPRSVALNGTQVAPTLP
jgi:hypothetical protein